MANLKQTWQYVKNGCRTCNATGVIQTPCPTWNNPEHTAASCQVGCQGGYTFRRCTDCVVGTR